MLVKNRLAVRSDYPAELAGIMSVAHAKLSRRWLSRWSALNPSPTPMWHLPDLARRTGVREVLIKDESSRSPLGSFKALGAPIALLRLVLRRLPGLQPEDVLLGHHARHLHDLVVISATDGNHGRALAAAARSVGVRCVIVLHKKVSFEREAAIAAWGAEIVRVEGNYDDSVSEAAALAAKHSWQVVSDTSYDGYEAIPRDVMQGYGTIADEVLAQLPTIGNDSSPITHVILQGGVGGLATGIVSYFWELYGDRRPVFLVVEPHQADCLMQSALKGGPTNASGSVDSVMAGLACGKTSPLAWRFLEPAVDFFYTLDDAHAIDAMRQLAQGSAGDIPIVSGESGAAGYAALTLLSQSPDHRRAIGLDDQSKVLLINTEGATAPSLYRELTGRCASDVQAAQRAWRGTPV